MSSPRDLWLARLADQLADRRTQQLERRLWPISGPQGPTLTVAGTPLVQFCTNNYLGLAAHPAVIAAAQSAAAQFGVGAAASRLVAGSMDLHHQLEAELAEFKHAEAALLFPTGFMANLAALTTFAGPHDRIVSDKLNHASLLDAARFSGATCRTFPHRHYPRAAELLAHPAPQPNSASLTPAPAFDTPTPTLSEGGVPAAKTLRFLVTDSVFSMDGDLADLTACCAVAQTHNALVVIDEAHATGVFGPTGAGVAELQNVTADIALTIGTLSKALGSVGGFITGPRHAIDTLINAARPFIYTTALPPLCAAAARAALHIVRSDEGAALRHRVLSLATRVRSALIDLGYDCGRSQSPIIPILVGESAAALRLAAFLRARGIWVPAIRPPTVAPHTARLRLSLMATHTDHHIDQLLRALQQAQTELNLKRPEGP